MQSSVVIMRYKYIMGVMQCQQNINQISNSQEKLHSSPVRASYGVSVVRIWQKIDRVIATPYCISIFFSSAEDDLCWHHVWERGHAQHHPLSLRMSTRGTRGLLRRWEMLFFLSFSIFFHLYLSISLYISLSICSLSLSLSLSFSLSLYFYLYLFSLSVTLSTLTLSLTGKRSVYKLQLISAVPKLVRVKLFFLAEIP